MVITAQNTNQKPGYKQTEVGEIPEDWEVKPLGEIASVSSGGTPDRSNPAYWRGDVPWVTTTQIDFNLIDKANEFITRKGLENSAARVYNPGTLLMAMYGQGKTRGKVAVLAINAAINQACAAIKVSKGISSKYVFFNLSARYEEIRSLSNTGNQENLNATIIKSILLPRPKDEVEQHAIATALSDVDALITSLDKLIAKKRDIKQATMQQLLTGKTRLPGFGGEWKVKKISEILRVRYGKSQQGVVVGDGKYPILATGGEIGRTNDHLYNKPSVLIGRKGTIDSPQYIDTPFWAIDTIFYTEVSDNIHPRFVFYLFNIINWLQYNEASGVPSLSASTIENIEVQCPSFFEQQAIATILSDMDAEIAVLEQKRDRTRALKQGIMQELLTGKTRLL